MYIIGFGKKYTVRKFGMIHVVEKDDHMLYINETEEESIIVGKIYDETFNL